MAKFKLGCRNFQLNLYKHFMMWAVSAMQYRSRKFILSTKSKIMTFKCETLKWCENLKTPQLYSTILDNVAPLWFNTWLTHKQTYKCTVTWPKWSLLAADQGQNDSRKGNQILTICFKQDRLAGRVDFVSPSSLLRTFIIPKNRRSIRYKD